MTCASSLISFKATNAGLRSCRGAQTITSHSKLARDTRPVVRRGGGGGKGRVMAVQLTAQREYLRFREEAGHDHDPVAVKCSPQLCRADCHLPILGNIQDRVCRDGGKVATLHNGIITSARESYKRNSLNKHNRKRDADETPVPHCVLPSVRRNVCRGSQRIRPRCNYCPGVAVFRKKSPSRGTPFSVQHSPSP